MTKAELNRLARENANSAAHEAFVEATKFAGSLNERTREHIEREAKRAWRYEFIGTYLRNGYSLCGCKSLVAPQFARCWVCGAWRKQPDANKALVERTFDAPARPAHYTREEATIEYVGDSPFVFADAADRFAAHAEAAIDAMEPGNWA